MAKKDLLLEIGIGRDAGSFCDRFNESVADKVQKWLEEKEN